MMSSDHRQGNGRFADGNPGGPGRPRRAVERQYLAALSDAISLEDWQEIVKATVTRAKEGDSKARDWLTRYVIGENPRTLTDLAADEAAEMGAERDILEAIANRLKNDQFQKLLEGANLVKARELLQRAEARDAQANE